MDFSTIKQIRATARHNLKNDWAILSFVFGIFNVIPFLFMYVTFITVIFSLFYVYTDTFLASSIPAFIMLGISLLISTFIFMSFSSSVMSALIIDIEHYKEKNTLFRTRIARIIQSGNVMFLFKVKILANFKILLFSLLLIVPGIIKAIEYSQAVNIASKQLQEKRDITVSHCLKESARLMYNHKLQLLQLYLSLAIWMILSFLVARAFSFALYSFMPFLQSPITSILVFSVIFCILYSLVLSYIKMSVLLFWIQITKQKQ